MADVKQILVVDDHFEMLEFLRTILEHSGRDYQVLAVPSAEEGMLERTFGAFGSFGGTPRPKCRGCA